MQVNVISRRTLLRGALAMPVMVGVASLGMAGTAQAYAWSRTLREGSSGADVVELQIRVAGFAASSAKQTYIAIDGSFGSGTKAAVSRFQKAHGMAGDGLCGPTTQGKLNALESSDGSTAHFDFSEFTSHDGAGFSGGKVSTSRVQENVRRNMWKLEALRTKVGDRPVSINSGFRSVAYNSSIGAASNSMHMYGIASDIVVSGLSTLSVYKIAETCGYSGLEAYSNSWQHVDSRMEHAYGSQFWWWESGTARRDNG